MDAETRQAIDSINTFNCFSAGLFFFNGLLVALVATGIMLYREFRRR